MNDTNVLIRHNYVHIPASDSGASTSKTSLTKSQLATVMMNLSYYGYALSVESYKQFSKLSLNQFVTWWTDLETELKSITGDDKNIGDFVVYKNFPKEVLDKTEAEYWLPQILMYWGFPKEFFTEEVEPRAKMKEQPRLTVLKLAKKDSLKEILDSHLRSPARWKDQELEEVCHLSDSLPVNMSFLAFKENMVRLATYLMDNGKKIRVSTATDVLRLAAGLSDGDVSLREKVKFKSFNKPSRKFLLSMLEDCGNIAEDVARRSEMWKKFLHHLHAGDYKKMFPRVCKVVNDLYHDDVATLNSEIEKLLVKKDPAVLDILSNRPGDFRRRLAHMLSLFGTKAVKAFTADEVLDKLTTAQIVSLRTHIETVNDRCHRVFPPKGNWSKLQIDDNPRLIEAKYVKAISKSLGKMLLKRVPKVCELDEATKMIKLPNNGEVGPYTRGTVFKIPKEVDFIRTVSYWKHNPTKYNTWFDNGWNFFDSNWKEVGSCSWTNVKFGVGSSKKLFGKFAEETAAVFSGDPVNSGEMKGRAAQMIDLYPEKLRAAGVRYAVWNILCFSRIPFSDAEEVFAALQWGKDAQSGKLFEPSRCQLAFPLTGKSMTKYICVLDLETNEMIYIDANLHGDVSSASNNGKSLETNMPPFMEYIKSLPSVHDLFRESVDKDGKLHVLYSDKDAELDGESAYVFRPENKESKFKSVDLNVILSE
jgi:hypothetical protein